MTAEKTGKRTAETNEEKKLLRRLGSIQRNGKNAVKLAGELERIRGVVSEETERAILSFIFIDAMKYEDNMHNSSASRLTAEIIAALGKETAEDIFASNTVWFAKDVPYACARHFFEEFSYALPEEIVRTTIDALKTLVSGDINSVLYFRSLHKAGLVETNDMDEFFKAMCGALSAKDVEQTMRYAGLGSFAPAESTMRVFLNKLESSAYESSDRISAGDWEFILPLLSPEDRRTAERLMARDMGGSDLRYLLRDSDGKGNMAADFVEAVVERKMEENNVSGLVNLLAGDKLGNEHPLTLRRGLFDKAFDFALNERQSVAVGLLRAPACSRSQAKRLFDVVVEQLGENTEREKRRLEELRIPTADIPLLVEGKMREAAEVLSNPAHEKLSSIKHGMDVEEATRVATALFSSYSAVVSMDEASFFGALKKETALAALERIIAKYEKGEYPAERGAAAFGVLACVGACLAVRGQSSPVFTASEHRERAKRIAERAKDVLAKFPFGERPEGVGSGMFPFGEGRHSAETANAASRLLSCFARRLRGEEPVTETCSFALSNTGHALLFRAKHRSQDIDVARREFLQSLVERLERGRCEDARAVLGSPLFEDAVAFAEENGTDLRARVAAGLAAEDGASERDEDLPLW